MRRFLGSFGWARTKTVDTFSFSHRWKQRRLLPPSAGSPAAEANLFLVADVGGLGERL
jgi:hypothetical protein